MNQWINCWKSLFAWKYPSHQPIIRNVGWTSVLVCTCHFPRPALRNVRLLDQHARTPFSCDWWSRVIHSRCSHSQRLKCAPRQDKWCQSWNFQMVLRAVMRPAASLQASCIAKQSWEPKDSYPSLYSCLCCTTHKALVIDLVQIRLEPTTNVQSCAYESRNRGEICPE